MEILAFLSKMQYNSQHLNINSKNLICEVENIMNPWHDIRQERVTPNDFVAVIEIEKGSKKKYELDKETGMLMLDRVLYTSTHYPANYGFLPRTYAGDDDPLDVLVLCTEPIVPMVLVRCYPIGVISMVDQKEVDDKIIAIPFEDPTYNSYRSIEALPNHLFQEMQHFFSVYKELEGKPAAVSSISGQKDALVIIENAIEEYKKRFPEELSE